MAIPVELSDRNSLVVKSSLLCPLAVDAALVVNAPAGVARRTRSWCRPTREVRRGGERGCGRGTPVLIVEDPVVSGFSIEGRKSDSDELIPTTDRICARFRQILGPLWA
uniref:Uncharacterized protein n=1 Tax=Oryza meridionalis TaxID=40149 RepID=A0A0E0EZF5_9ORYZ